MSNWKVSKEQIQIFNHSNADKLQVGKVGSYQVVVQAGLYQDGDIVVFAPEKSVLTGRLKTEYENYLAGSNKDRVKEVRLRGEVSAGIIIPNELWVDGVTEAQVGEDISTLFGITKYEPPIPQQLAGKIKAYDMPNVGSHDCEQYAVYQNEFIQNERVLITEKLHGCCDENTILLTEDGEKTIKEICDSKYLGKVLSFNLENTKEEFKQILGHSIQDNIHNWYEIETEDNRIIKLTENHYVFLPELNCYRKVKDLTEKDQVCIFSVNSQINTTNREDAERMSILQQENKS